MIIILISIRIFIIVIIITMVIVTMTALLTRARVAGGSGPPAGRVGLVLEGLPGGQEVLRALPGRAAMRGHAGSGAGQPITGRQSLGLRVLRQV